MPVLDVRGLTLSIGPSSVLRGVDLAVGEGEIVGLVGASGSGKSLTALSIMRLLPPASRLAGRITLDGADLSTLDEEAMCRVRGRAIGMVFQEPATALNPLRTIGDQVAEGFVQHQRLPWRDARAAAARELEAVGLPASSVPQGRYPHELSGGQRQRVVIAMALALKPRLVLADEPTTALDVTSQAQILRLLRSRAAGEGAGLFLISHDLSVVAAMADTVLVLDQGRIVEQDKPARLLRNPRAFATRALVEAVQHVPARRPAPAGKLLLRVEDARRWHALPRPRPFAPHPRFIALDGVSLTVRAGESVGIVGESGSGKSTLSRVILALEPLQGGRITLDDVSPAGLGGSELRAWRRRVQMVFQDPFGSFDPRQRAGRLVGEPLHLLPGLPPHERRARISAALRDVGLRDEDALKFPHEFSGGQRQRLAIARALITRPDLVVLDEPVSALDVVTRAQILELLADLQARHGLAYLFVSHDLAVVRAVTDRVLVMRRGRVVEEGPTEEVLSAPTHAYTRSLVDASLHLGAVLAGKAGELSEN